MNTVFPLISAPGAYLISMRQGAAFIGGGRCLFHSKSNYSLEISKLCNSLFPNYNKKLPL